MAAPIANVVVGWIGGAGGVAAGVAMLGPIGVALVEVGVGLALSALGRALAPKPKGQARPGIKSEQTLEGANLSQTLILGKAATSCYVVAPFYATGKINNYNDTDTDLENAYRWMVLDIADYPINSVTAIWLNGVKFRNPEDFTGDIMTGLRKANPSTKPKYATTERPDLVQMRVYDGRQTAASTHLVNLFSNRSKRPWLSTAVGKGVAYIIIALRVDDDVWQGGEPRVLVEVEGARLYDRSQDSTNGGSGTQRENNEATWVWGRSQNPILQVENLMHGITLEDGSVYGVGVPWEDLPYNVWQSAKGTCFSQVNGRDRYQTGYEVTMATPDAGGDDPFAVIDELLKGCSGALADVGGQFRVRAGPPALPIETITDDDIFIDRDQEQILHEGVTGVYNSVRALFPNAAQQWKTTEGPIRENATYLAEDGEPLFAELPLPAVSVRNQVQQLTLEYLKDSRRKRAHTLVMHPKFSGLAPLDVVTWTSTRRNYVTKSFEIQDVAIDPETLYPVWSIKEVDPNDYNPNTDSDPGDPDPDVLDLEALTGIPDFTVDPFIIKDEKGRNRRPGFRFTWKQNLSGMKWVTIQGRTYNTQVEVVDKTITDPKRGRAVVSEGIASNRRYDFRVKSNKTKWSPWFTVRADKVRFGRDDIENNAVGAGKLKVASEANDWKVWDLEDDTQGPDEDDPSFEITGGTSTYTWYEGGNAQGAGHIRVARDGASNAVITQWARDAVAIRDNRHWYYVEIEMKLPSGSNTGAVHPQIQWLNAQRNVIGTVNLSPNGNANLLVDSSYRLYSDLIKPPSGARFSRGRIVIDDGGPSILYVDRYLFRKANGDELIADGMLTGNKAKTGDWTRQIHARSGTLVNTPPPGSARKIISAEIDLDGKTMTDIEFATVGDSVGQTVAGKMDFTATNFLQIWARPVPGSTWVKIDEQKASYRYDDNPTIPIEFHTLDTTRRLGRWLYEVRVYTPGSNSGCEVDYRHHHLRIGQKRK